MIGSGSATRFPVVGENVNNLEDIFEPDRLTLMGPEPGGPPTDCATSVEVSTADTDLYATRDSDLETSGEACENQPNKLWIATWRAGVGDDGVGNLKSNNENETTDDPEAFGNNTACLLYTSPSPRDLSTSRMPSSA